MSKNPEEELRNFIQRITVDKKTIAREVLKHADLLQDYLEFHDDVVVVKGQERLSRRAVLALYLIGKFLLYVVGRIDFPDLSLEDVSMIIGGSDSPEVVTQEFLSAGWILMTSSDSFRLNFRRIGEILRELVMVQD